MNKTWEIFKSFWYIRKPYWLGSDLELVEDILTDNDFLEAIYGNIQIK